MALRQDDDRRIAYNHGGPVRLPPAKVTKDLAEATLTTTLPAVTLVLGGARSGKSALAEALILQSGLVPVYLATAQPLDGEMAARIEHHRGRRGDAWLTFEVPLELPEALRAHAQPDRAILVDCLTLWLTNLMIAQRDPNLAVEGLVAALAQLRGPLVLVSNEVGQGIVPMGAMSREFVDHAGRMHQRLAAAADWVRLVVAGLPLDLKRPDRASACIC